MPQQPPAKHVGSIAADANFLEEIDVNQVASVVDLHRSNLLRIQAQELVQECSLSPDKSWVKTAHSYMEHVSSIVSRLDLSETLKEQSLPAAPFVTRRSDRNAAGLSFRDPLQVSQLDHPLLGMSTCAGNANVLPTFTLHVKIPTSVLEPKDYLRNRYFDKRNTIVWAVACQLQKQYSDSIGSVYWQYTRGDQRKPNLLLVPPTLDAVQAQPNTITNNKKNKKRKQKQDEPAVSTLARTKTLKFRVQLIFGFGPDGLDWIPTLRLLPNRCNLASSEQCTTSQMYNHALMEDALVGVSSSENDSDDDTLLDEIQSILQATCLLAKTWCLQRGLLRAHDGFDVEQLLAVLLYLFRTRQANARMAPTQVLATFWKLLVSTDWIGEHASIKSQHSQQSLIRVAPSEAYQGAGSVVSSKRAALVMPRPGKTENQTIATCKLGQVYAQQTKESPLTDSDPSTLLELWQTRYILGPVLLDSTMRYNFLGRCSPSYMREMVLQSQMALDRLHERLAFETLFMRHARFWSGYDVYMRVPLHKMAFGLSELWGQDQADLGDYESIARGLVQVLRVALGDRVHAIRLLTTGSGEIKNAVAAIYDSDETPAYPVADGCGIKGQSGRKLASPNGSAEIVIGVTINSDTCYRIVDRGPPADDVQATANFLKLWGKKKAQLRRFKDGAIIHACVWDTTVEDDENTTETSYIRFHNDDKQQGGIVERIMRHILKLHFISDAQASPDLQFSLRNVMSAVDGVLPKKTGDDSPFMNQLSAHRMLLKAFDSLTEFLRTNSAPTVRQEGSSEMTSRLGIPLAVDAVEPICPALRYAELFPPIPHPELGAILYPKVERISGAVLSNPIEVQIRFGVSSKWPTDIKAIGAAKAAMLVRLVDGIDRLKRSGSGKGFDGAVHVTSSYVDLGYMGYVFRIRVRADPEIKLLSSLSQPSPEAVAMLHLLTKRHVVAAKHHSLVHAVYTSHPSSSAVTRLATRWVSSHLLSGHLTFEAVELLVVHAYTDKTSASRTPGSVTAGFMRFLELLSDFDWARQAMIVDPQSHFDDEGLNDIQRQFEKIRGPEWKHGAPMFIVSPSCSFTDELESFKSIGPLFTETYPETVVLLRASALARRTFDFLQAALINGEPNTWPAAFQETASSFRSYSALLRVDSDFCIDFESSSTGGELAVISNKSHLLSSGFTRSMSLRIKGPKSLQRKEYRNLENRRGDTLLFEFNPVEQSVSALRRHLGKHLLVFYNDLCPDVLSILWRRPRLAPHAFSAAASEFVRPVLDAGWKNDTLVTINVKDLLRSMSHYTQDIIVDYKVFDHGLAIAKSALSASTKPRAKRKAVVHSESDNSDSENEEKANKE